MISSATLNDFDAIAELNVEAYREFAVHMSPDSWRGMETSLRTVTARAHSTRFLVMREQGAIVGSVGYCPAGKGNPEIFPATLGRPAAPRGRALSPRTWHREGARLCLHPTCTGRFS